MENEVTSLRGELKQKLKSHDRKLFQNRLAKYWKHPFYSFVNIVGLLTGITFTMLIAAYVWGELQVNKDLKNADRQYILQQMEQIRTRDTN